MLLVLFNPKIGPYQVLPLRARVNLGAMAMKGYSAFPKASALLELLQRELFDYLSVCIDKMRLQIIYLMEDLAMNNPQWLICH